MRPNIVPHLQPGELKPRPVQEQEAPEPAPPILEVFGKWRKGPSKGDKYSEAAVRGGLIAFGPLKVDVFDLRKPADLKRMNTLFENSAEWHGNNGTPSLAIQDSHKEVVGGAWLVYIGYKEIYYRNVNTSKK